MKEGVAELLNLREMISVTLLRVCLFLCLFGAFVRGGFRALQELVDRLLCCFGPFRVFIRVFLGGFASLLCSVEFDLLVDQPTYIVRRSRLVRKVNLGTSQALRQT